MPRPREVLKEEIRQATPRSLAQWERGQATMPGGVIKGAYSMVPHPIYIERAEDCYLWDIDGRRYVDFTNHHTAMVLGHSPPAVIEALNEAVASGLGFGAPSTLEAEMAEEIVERFPSIEKVRIHELRHRVLPARDQDGPRVDRQAEGGKVRGARTTAATTRWR